MPVLYLAYTSQAVYMIQHASDGQEGCLRHEPVHRPKNFKLSRTCSRLLSACRVHDEALFAAGVGAGAEGSSW